MKTKLTILLLALAALLPAQAEILSHRSQYLPDKKVNAYCNHIKVVMDYTGHDVNYDFWHHIESGLEIPLIRDAYLTIYDPDTNSSHRYNKTIATITIETITQDGGTYRVAMHEDTQSEADLSLYPTKTTGEFTIDDSGLFHFDDLIIVDQFSEDTSLNGHPAYYYYYLSVDSDPFIIVDAPANNTNKKISFDKPSIIYADWIYIQGLVVVESSRVYTKISTTTREAWENDNNHDAPAGCDLLMLGIWVDDDPSVQRYDVMCDDTKIIAQAFRNSDGTYSTKALNADGNLVDQKQNIEFNAGDAMMGITIRPVLDLIDCHDFMVKVTTIKEDAINGGTVENTYGSEIRSEIGRGIFTSTVSNLLMSTKLIGVTDPRQSYACDITLSHTLPDNSYFDYNHWLPSYYRLWRINPDGTETELSEYDTQNESLAVNRKKIYNNDATIEVHDLFIDKPIDAFENGEFDITYIARLYGRIGQGTTPTGPGSWWYYMGGDPNVILNEFDYELSEDSFTIFESRQTVTFNAGITTGLRDVTANSNPVAVTYYNLAGVASYTPFDGVNIVVTRYSDGTTMSQKLLR